MQILDFQLFDYNRPFEPFLIGSLVVLLILTTRQSERFIKITSLCISLFIAYYAYKSWHMNFKHWSIAMMIASLFGFGIMYVKSPSEQFTKRFFAIWLVIVIFGVWYLDFAKQISFREMHHWRDPLNFKFSGYTAWSIFAALSVVILYCFKNKAKVFIIWVAAFWLFTINLEGVAFSTGLAKRSEGLYWGGGVDKVDPYLETPLYHAVESGKIEEARQLLSRGADPNKEREMKGGPTTPFQMTIHTGNYEMFLLLLENGGDLEKPNNSGEYPIHIASSPKSNIKITKYLIKHGADVNLANKYGKQPIHIAVIRTLAKKGREREPANTELIGLLLDNGADINALSYKTTPLMLAAMNGNAKAVKFLIERGADIFIKDGMNKTALEHAEASLESRKKHTILETEPHEEIITYLRPLYEDSK